MKCGGEVGAEADALACLAAASGGLSHAGSVAPVCVARRPPKRRLVARAMLVKPWLSPWLSAALAREPCRSVRSAPLLTSERKPCGWCGSGGSAAAPRCGWACAPLACTSALLLLHLKVACPGGWLSICTLLLRDLHACTTSPAVLPCCCAGQATPCDEPRRDKLMRSGDGGVAGDPLASGLSDGCRLVPSALLGEPPSIDTAPVGKAGGELGCDANEAGEKGLWGADAARWWRRSVVQPGVWRRASAALMSEPTSITSLHARMTSGSDGDEATALGARDIFRD